MSNKKLVNVDNNPCKMCMPMGGVMAFKGIENNMVILHGSQGCSTYIRRHMATHYNEPVDIASSALTEQGTVYGGSKNLKKGLRNMIKMYNPTSIGVLTTCLAETIGEDTKRIIEEFYEEEKDNKDIKNIKIITAPTPGYGATQAEGYYVVLRKIVEQICEKSENTGKLNIICGNLNPGDVRNIKSILDDFKIGYTLLPDVSNTLDSAHNEKYRRIPKGGTKLEDIKKMSGAVATIEMGVTISDENSPGVYLRDEFGVPLYKCPIPIGLRNTNQFMSLISKTMGFSIPYDYLVRRGRYLDAMIDNHKYTGEARIILYGEPELVYATARLCLENGILIKMIGMGSKNPDLREKLKDELKSQKEDSIVLDDTDFGTMENYARKLKINLLIGNSDGRRMAKKLGIKMVRIGFPIHDRVGGQRQILTGYNGASFLIDSVANAMLDITQSTYREKAYKDYYIPIMEMRKGDKMEIKKDIKIEDVEKNHILKSNADKTCTHPCFGDNAHKFARMHIPVAPKCNISCNYCSRKYDCANESRPGVTSKVLTPEQALEKFKFVKSKIKNLTVVGIAGPGDALANFDEVKKSLELIRKESPETTFCLSTNGLMLPFYANQLIELGVSHVTVTMNAIDKKIGAKIYREVNYLGHKYTGEEGAEILLNNQLNGIRYLCSKGIICKVNMVMLKGINDKHIKSVVKKVKECGAYITNIMQMIPVQGSKFEDLPLISNVELNSMRKECEIDMKQMYHCKQCRADAIGTLGEDRSINFRNIGCGHCGVMAINKKDKNEPEKEIIKGKKYKFAISTKSGVNIDQHFGHANEFYIYSYEEGTIRLLEKRNVDKYCTGIVECDEHEDKISKTIKAIGDCNAVIVLRAGIEPTEKLKANGIKVIEMYDSINKGINRAAKILEETELLQEKTNIK
ncbi:nitrogenase cofactor biosynthesis protein NifB [Clostridium tyrobutyricum]|uniref:nitrogenase cofactor biosynthesis protein NifB n=1 Tax=Clostridium tyrobutyricum TaxID=1519 RepID=UPI001C386E9C|nr:nitrogenase cofactor biosynthesis protein NifB [Clostridium tyrobutyricum]MBV4417496.1 nitrogenase cofactor biosynthesis protein NifB [Clostridium tyrobutyricum]